MPKRNTLILIVGLGVLSTVVGFKYFGRSQPLENVQTSANKCATLSKEELADAYAHLLPSTIEVAEKRISTLEKQAASIEHGHVFATDVSLEWIHILSIGYEHSIGADENLRASLKAIIDRFKTLLISPKAPLKISTEFTHEKIIKVTLEMLPAGIDNLNLRLSTLQDFNQKYPQYKPVTTERSAAWAGFVDARIKKLEALNDKRLKPYVDQLDSVLKELKKLSLCL